MPYLDLAAACAEAAGEEVTFRLTADGQRFRCLPLGSYQATAPVVLFVARVAPDDVESAGSAPIALTWVVEFIRGVLCDEDEDAFDRLLKEKAKPIPRRLLLETAFALVEAYVGRPTERPTVLDAGPLPAGGTSKESSRKKAAAKSSKAGRRAKRST